MPLATCNGAILIVWRAGFTGIEPVRHTMLVVYPAKKDLQIDLQVLFSMSSVIKYLVPYEMIGRKFFLMNYIILHIIDNFVLYIIYNN